MPDYVQLDLPYTDVLKDFNRCRAQAGGDPIRALRLQADMMEHVTRMARRAATFLANHPEAELVPWVDTTTEPAVFSLNMRQDEVLKDLGIKVFEREVPESIRLPQIAADADLQAEDGLVLPIIAPIPPDVIVDAIARVEQAGFRPRWILMNVIEYADVRKWCWTAPGACDPETKRSRLALGIMGYIGEVTVVASRQAPVGLILVIPEPDAGGRYPREGFVRISVTR